MLYHINNIKYQYVFLPSSSSITGLKIKTTDPISNSCNNPGAWWKFLWAGKIRFLGGHYMIIKDTTFCFLLSSPIICRKWVWRRQRGAFICFSIKSDVMNNKRSEISKIERAHVEGFKGSTAEFPESRWTTTLLHQPLVRRKNPPYQH